MQLSIILFLTAAVLASTVQGMPQVQETPQQSSSATNGTMQELEIPEQSESEITVDDLAYTATNGSTLEDIMHELHMDLDIRTRRQAGCTFSAGTYGGGGGGGFNELIDNCAATIRRITLHSGHSVDGIQITYRLSNGYEYAAGHHGGFGGGRHVININVDGGERIIGVFGKSGRLLDQIGFITNHGRTLGPYGGCGGGAFHVNSCQLRGIFGRSGHLIDSIGFFCSHL